MLEEISKYEFIGILKNDKEKKDIEFIMYNHNIPYKIGEEKADLYVAYKYKELGNIIFENYRKNNLIFKKTVDVSFIKKREQQRYKHKKKSYRQYFFLLLLLGLILLFYRSLSLLNIL
ncbi:hypothetical protein [Helicovermis profundi]|uniref:Uncharacterized protein n=1 Tax=Helicovermis profundi TaxID=3065157 RepID=A0AAU9EBP9_9FIRM|nr:hypothetical protein HLPR_03080 [Clostridia bacterium S502]